ncbi:Exodeoxyribonuclease 7 large subunit [Planctomycetes bacterium Poly30]|uniref:Exodeoxyribonuclease 7 large subunit n=1 Tax=Saltatorellus ferox TaxID=2528018 RepID=A0A518ERF6_9BACT|nr:Exodeoxyribonuclease 7 large subunit [Planctomycetes bacterium Poly30]
MGELTARIDAALKRFGRVAVEGEISRPKTVASGHVFFTLKDARAAIDAKIWRGQLQKALPPGMKLEDGARVVCHGTLDVYAPYGKHSLIVDRVEARGIGALLADLERLKAQLREEGLFDQRRPLPRFPRMVGVVTSRDADAWRDFLRTRSLRWAGYPVRIAHSRVQGKTAANEIARAIQALDRSGVDVIVVCRGGGAIEDLWCFNEEVVARAIHACSVPVVTGVGHETDTTLADFVADHRAHTPTDAAQTVLPDQRAIRDAIDRQSAYLGDVIERLLAHREERLARAGRSRALNFPGVLVQERAQRLDGLGRRARASLEARIAERATRLERMASRLERQSPLARLARVEERLGALHGRLQSHVDRRLEVAGERLGRAGASQVAAMERILERATRRLEPAARTLEAVSPLAVLERGYSITQTAGGVVVTDPTTLAKGAVLKTIVRGGEVESTVVEARAKPAKE